MAAQFEYELTHEGSPLHEFEFELEADPFFGKALSRIRRIAGPLIKRMGPILKRLAPIAAKIVAGAIPGVGVVAGPLAGKLVSALTQEQQHELESILHEASLPHPEFEMASHEGIHSEFEGYNPEFQGYNPETEAYNPEMEGFNPELEGYNPELEAYNPEMHYNPEFEGYNPEFTAYNPEGAHPEFEAEMHPEFESGVGHSEAAHQEAVLMEQIAHEAASSSNEAEAEALAGALIPIVMRGVSSAAPAMRTAAPALARATGRLVGALRRSPATRPLIRTVPTILRRTNVALNRAAAGGTPVSPRLAVRTMANQTYRIMSSPTVCIHIMVRSGRMMRRNLMRRTY
jgi:hypothetical protein